MTDHDNIQTAIDAGKQLAARVENINGIPCIVAPTAVLPLDDVIKVADARAERPRRRTGTANMQAIDSFCDYVNRYKSDASTVRADASKRSFTAILNDHAAGAASDPAWGDHRAIYPCPLSTEWKEWGNGAEMTLSQDAFATFLVRHERDLAVGAGSAPEKPYPSPADLMTLAASLESFSGMKNRRERDVRTGKIKISFSEESGIKGDVAIPPAFGIVIPIFEDDSPALVEVGLRVEVRDGAALFIIGVNDSPKVLRAAFAQLVEYVKSMTALPVFIGTSEQ